MGTPLDTANRGVLALASSLVSLCSEAAGEVQIVFLLGQRGKEPVRFRVGGRERLFPVVNCRLSPRVPLADQVWWIVAMSLLYRALPLDAVRRAIARSTPWIHAAAEADMVGDIRGGDSFSDIYGIRRFLFGFFMAWSVILVRGSLIQLPQTYGPYKTRLARYLARYILRRSSTIIARDAMSMKVAQDLAASPVILSPDVAFSLEPAPIDEIDLEPPLTRTTLSAPTASVLGLNVSGLLYHGGRSRNNMFGLKLDYASFVPALVKALLREHEGELWLVPHTFAPDCAVESDPEASRIVRNQAPPELRSRIRIVSRPYDQHSIKTVISRCDFFIGSRMHACIAALSQGIPCVGIAYSMKFHGVFDSVGMGDWVVDGSNTTNQAAIDRVLELYARRVEARETLHRRAAEARCRLREVFGDLIADARKSLNRPNRSSAVKQ